MLGAIGVAVSMPRRGVSWALIGGIVAAAAGGLIVLGMSLRAFQAEQIPNLFFYAFAALALGSGLRMITHPRPVYAALYFILTILSSSGLYLLLSAEFMAFALIIIYAGAILITYLFVIMLATQAPTDDDVDALDEYDAKAREPWAGSIIGFVLMAVLTTMVFRGTPSIEAVPSRATDGDTLAELPQKVERALIDDLRAEGLMAQDETFARVPLGRSGTEGLELDFENRTILTLAIEEESGREVTRTLVVPEDLWPEDLGASNVEALGLNLLADHPMTIEIAGVILLMAMLGATVLARKQVDIEEEAKAKQAERLAMGLSPREGEV